MVEHVVLSTGRALVGTADATVELHPGAHVTCAADVPHVFQALEPHTQAVFISEHT